MNTVILIGCLVVLLTTLALGHENSDAYGVPDNIVAGLCNVSSHALHPLLSLLKTF